MTANKSAKGPISKTVDPALTETEGKLNAEMHELYRSGVGVCNYLGQLTRPECVFAVSMLSSVLNNPCMTHFLQMMELIQYLVNTKTLAIEYSPAAIRS